MLEESSFSERTGLLLNWFECLKCPQCDTQSSKVNGIDFCGARIKSRALHMVWRLPARGRPALQSRKKQELSSHVSFLFSA